ncbi:MAG TPA: type 1 glutamine amidotransferase [Methanoregulaceae archaeon]|nr:type 1 glutamine amidotransferase [Methanoregulaceae archaeon]
MITIFQHGIGEPAGHILDIIEKIGLEYEIIRLYTGDRVPERITSSHYIFLGGLMSANDEEHYPWLAEEKYLIRDSILSGVPVLGICLGAQLIASSCSKEVRGCTEEKGWTVIRNHDRSDTKRFGEEVIVFEWHSEGFELPEGSSLIYKGDVVPNQMFTIGSSIGVQFHPEINESVIREWTAAEPLFLKDKILQAMPACIGQSRVLCGEIMDQFLRRGN